MGKEGAKDTVTQGIARFALKSKFKDFQPDVLERLKLHLLDSLGCALAVAYEVECRLTAGAPIMGTGFDHTTQLAYSIAAGAGRLLGLNEEQLCHALGLVGAELNPLAVTRAAPTTQWKGFASSNAAFD